MNITSFFAQFWGPIILAIGLGFFTSKGYYIRLYKDLQKEPLATLTFGVLAMIIGIFQISIVNNWGSFNEVIISLLGWGTLVKGVAFLVVPNFADKVADWEVAKKLVPGAGVLAIIAGLYITWIGYFV